MGKKKSTSTNDWSVDFISLSSQIKTPSFEVSEQNDVYFFGDENNLPSKLTKFLVNVPMHSAIINRKSNLILAGGLVDANGNPLKENPNPFENWNSLVEKLAQDVATYNESYLKVGWERGGAKPKEFYHVIHDKVRLSNPINGTFKSAFINEKYNDPMYEWTVYNQLNNMQKIDLFNSYNKKIVQLLHLKKYNPITEYGLPDYFSALKDLDTLAEISTFHNANIHNNMQPGFQFLFTGNPPSPDEKKKIIKDIKSRYKSAENAGVPLILWIPDGATGTIEPLKTSDVSKMYNLLSKEVKENILVSHQIPKKIAGLETSGSLGSSKEILEQLDFFKTSVIKPMQTTILNYLEPLLGMELMFKEQPNDLLMMFSIDELSTFLTQNEIRELTGNKPTDEIIQQPKENFLKRIFK